MHMMTYQSVALSKTVKADNSYEKMKQQLEEIDAEE